MSGFCYFRINGKHLLLHTKHNCTRQLKRIGGIWLFCWIVSKQFKKYLTLHVDNSKQ